MLVQWEAGKVKGYGKMAGLKEKVLGHADLAKYSEKVDPGLQPGL